MMRALGDDLLPDLLVYAGTAAMLLVASHANLLLLVSLKLQVRLARRRVVILPSGVVMRERELVLPVGVDCGLSLLVLVRRGEDAEGDRDAGLKVQIGGLDGRREGRLFSSTFRTATKGRQEDPSCFFLKIERKWSGGGGLRVDTPSYSTLFLSKEW